MRALKGLLIGIVLLWGLLALLVRAATPLIADYRDEIAAYVGTQLDAPVRIGAVRARWYGFKPLLELDDVTIGAAADVVAVRSVLLAPSVSLAGLTSVRGAIEVTLDGLHLTVIRDRAGRVHVQGLGLREPAAGGPAALPRQLRLVNARVTWVDRLLDRAPVELRDIDVALEHRDRRFLLRARLAAHGGTAQLAADLDRPPTAATWQGDSHLVVRNLDVASLLGPYLPSAYTLQSLQLDLESWTRWEDARPASSQGHFAMRELLLQATHGTGEPLQVESMSAGFTAQRAPGRLDLGLQDLLLTFPGHHWPVGDSALSVERRGADGLSISLGVSYLEIGDLTRILRVRMPAASGIEEPLNRLRPRGALRGLRLHYALDGNRHDWRAAARFTQLVTEPWGDIPGLTGLSGELLGRDGHVVVQLDSSDTTVRFAKLFRNPLQLQSLNARVDVTFDANGWQVRSDRIVADTAHISTLTRLFFDQRRGRPMFIDLQSDFADGDGAFASLYYPADIMAAPLVSWLDAAIVSGRVPAGSALVYGPIDDFPFHRTGNGAFEVVFDTDDVRLDVKTGWPGISGLDARVRFHGNELDIRSETATLYSSRVDSLTARIASLKPVSPLQVRGQLTGPLGDPLLALQEDALRSRFGRFAEAVAGRGTTRLVLDFDVPLNDTDAYRLDGELQFDNNTLRIPDFGLDVNAIRGNLRFTLEGLFADAVSAEALGAPLLIDVHNLADGTTRIRTRGALAYRDLAEQFNFLPPHLVTGRSEYTVDIDIGARDARQASHRLSVRSNLEGTRVDLPAPLAKTAAQSMPLELSLALGDAGAVGTLQLGGDLGAHFQASGERTAVAFGEPIPELPDNPGIRVGGRLEQFDPLAWQRVLASLDDMRLASASATGTPIDVDLEIGRLALQALPAEQLRIKARRVDGTWSGSLSSDRVAGRFRAPVGAGRATVSVDLERLHLHLATGGMSDDASPAPPDPADGPDPRDLPGLQLTAKDLRLNDARLGRLVAKARPVDAGLGISEISVDSELAQLDSVGEWLVADEVANTRLGGTLRSADIGALLAAIGYPRQFDGANGAFDWLLRWPGHPGQAHARTLEGELELAIGPGRLVELEPGVGRVIGLLNLNALTRRLRLDFSDLFGKGFSFDGISGAFAFSGGRAVTEHLAIDGPTGRLHIKGAADLVAQTLDQHVTLYPDATATLPIAGAIAGGPVAGAAVLLAQQVMARQVDNINRFEYRVTGPWDQPAVERLETGGALSRLIAPATSTAGKPDRVDPAAPAATTHEGGGSIEDSGDVSAQNRDNALNRALRKLVDQLNKGVTTDEPVPPAD